MSIKIVTVEKAKEIKKLCEKYDEHFEEVIGKAKRDYICDSSGVAIPKDTECSAILVLTTKHHPNYQHQKEMLKEFIN